MSSKDSGETRCMYTKSNNIEITMGSETDDIIKELSKVLVTEIKTVWKVL